ncbi:MAG: hypothetical protein Kow0020_09630 [Wenzhouxiangellaceae bacterium]
MSASQPAPDWTYPPHKALSTQVNSVAVDDTGSRCVFGTWLEEGRGSFAVWLLDGNGRELWCEALDQGATVQGGVYWTAISGDGHWVAAGGERAPDQGFLLAWGADGAVQRLVQSTPSRVNQLSLDATGRRLVACYGSTVAFYLRDPVTLQYRCVGERLLADAEGSSYQVISCQVSASGDLAAACGIRYETDGSTRGCVSAWRYTESGSLEALPAITFDTGCMRVAVSRSGAHWAVSLHDGSCALIDASEPGRPVWRHDPGDTGLGVAYAVAVCEPEPGAVFVVCGANVDANGADGLLYKVTDHNGAPQLEWKRSVARGINPGVSTDVRGRWVTVTDGEPAPDHSSESAGAFYLYSGTGALIWSYPTRLMNWPMMISADGRLAVGGTDGGMVYGWRMALE